MVSRIESAVKGLKPTSRHSTTTLGKQEEAVAREVSKGGFSVKATRGCLRAVFAAWQRKIWGSRAFGPISEEVNSPMKDF
jgi:hypothetical protein